jgi:chitinase
MDSNLGTKYNHMENMYNRIMLILFILVSIDASSQSTAFRIIGYVPNWIDVNTFANSFNYKEVTHLNFAFQNPDANGNLVEDNTGLTTLVANAHNKNVKVLISIGGAGAADGTVKNNYQNLISTSDKRAGFIHKILLYIKQFELDGVDVDEEGTAINSNYGVFIQQLSDSLKPAGKYLSCAVGWGSENINNATLPLFDWVNIMAYDLTGTWDPSNPGQHSPYWYAQSTINDWLGRGVKKENLVLGVPFYGYGFGPDAGDYTYKDIIAMYPDAYTKDVAGDSIYFNGTVTIWKKTRLALEKVSGIMIWELSGDASGDKSLLKVIASTVDSAESTGINSISNSSGMDIYPNPASDRIFILNDLPGKRASYIQILDIGGRVVKTIDIGNILDNHMEIDISELSKGTYICRVVGAKTVESELFIKN